MRRFESAPAEPDIASRYDLDEPRFSGGKDILRNQEDINYGSNPRNQR